MYIRRRARRFLLRRPRLTRRTALRLMGLTMLALTLYTVTMSARYLRRLSMELALSDATDTVIMGINSAVGARMRDENMGYDRFVALDKNESGAVTAIRTNMAEINALAADMLEDIVGEGGRRTLEIRVPLGNLLGSSFLLGKGPAVPVRIIMLSSSRIDFRNELTAAGINQTRHRIVFEVTVAIDVLIPWDVDSTTVRSDIPVAETVIVGTVPETYISLE
jgi:sporulation protein YunB